MQSPIDWRNEHGTGSNQFRPVLRPVRQSALLRRPEEFKRSIVRQYTRNRTESLREMTRAEYNECCAALEQLTGQDEWRKKLRGAAVPPKRMSETHAENRHRHHGLGKGQRFLPESPDRRQCLSGGSIPKNWKQLARKAALHRAEGRAESEGNEKRQEHEVKQPGRTVYVIIDPNAPKKLIEMKTEARKILDGIKNPAP